MDEIQACSSQTNCLRFLTLPVIYHIVPLQLWKSGDLYLVYKTENISNHNRSYTNWLFFVHAWIVVVVFLILFPPKIISYYMEWGGTCLNTMINRGCGPVIHKFDPLADVSYKNLHFHIYKNIPERCPTPHIDPYGNWGSSSKYMQMTGKAMEGYRCDVPEYLLKRSGHVLLLTISRPLMNLHWTQGQLSWCTSQSASQSGILS